MNTPQTADVSVIIAAHNAEGTLDRAIHSALRDPRIHEVLIVDDASTDGTADLAETAHAIDPRVKLIVQDTNRGPAAARNRGLDAATAPYVAVLDADDFFLPGRLDVLLSQSRQAELVADNLIFVNAERAVELTEKAPGTKDAAFQKIGLTAFVRGNLRQRGVARGELGFLKPIMSKSFLDKHRLRYDETLRLGEDYDLYVRMLLAGARLTLTRRPGYAAVIRATSLSAQHSAFDLQNLSIALSRHLAQQEIAPKTKDAMRTHLAEVSRKRDHRIFLDRRKTVGNRAALLFAFGALGRPWPIAWAIAKDKLKIGGTAGQDLPADGMRLLIPEVADP